MHGKASGRPEGSRVAVGRTARWLVLAALPLLAHCVSAPQLVQNNALAFAYRAGTAAAAERSLDVQYYLWQADFTGKLLAAELLRAAERGVKVRVLIDDLDARAKHDLFAIADLHPNVEVRIFNPFYDRYGVIGQWSEFVLRGSRLNRRMHNKAWVADNRVAIVGGRNIGDEYFGASEQSNFSDTDVVLVGPVVEQVSREFDAYWNSPDAVPVSRFEARKPKPEQLQQLSLAAAQFSHEAGETPYIEALRDPAQRAELLRRAPPLVRASGIRVLADDPGKIGAEEAEGLHPSLVLNALMQVVGQASSEVLVVSPYFVPGRQGAANLVESAQRGIRVAVLTNSLAATDIVAVHVGYALSPRAAAGRRRALRDEAPVRGRRGRRSHQPDRLVTGEPAHQGDDRGQALGIRRLDEPRSALGQPQHRAGRAG
jgi:cardiolipin synthase C